MIDGSQSESLGSSVTKIRSMTSMAMNGRIARAAASSGTSAMLAPMLGDCYTARAGSGAQRNGTPLRVTRHPALS